MTVSLISKSGVSVNLDELLSYDPKTGALTWLPRPSAWFPNERACQAWNTRYAGMPACGALDGKGYRQGCIFGKLYRSHRIAWALATGEWPDGDIDHINGVGTDNRFENLRDVTHPENMRNVKRPATNTSGVIGVYWFKRTGKWIAHIKVAQRPIHLGYFTELDDAIAARKAAEIKHGFHENHGRESLP